MQKCDFIASNQHYNNDLAFINAKKIDNGIVKCVSFKRGITLLLYDASAIKNIITNEIC